MNAWIQAILSFLIPGLGQAISRYYIRALVIFLVALAIDAVNFFWFGNSLIGNIVDFIYALAAAYDAYTLAAE